MVEILAVHYDAEALFASIDFRLRGSVDVGATVVEGLVAKI